MQNDFSFCPKCGSKKIQNINDRKWSCPDCGFSLYNNVAASVGVLIFDDDSNFLFEVRAKEPKKGMLTQPGGFVDADESAETAVQRECFEELGIKVCDIKYLCTCPNDYEYKGIAYKTCDMFFTAKIEGCSDLSSFLEKMNRQQTEVTAVELHKITNEAELEKLPLAFVSTRNALKFYLKNKE